jgi:hypothetical protein
MDDLEKELLNYNEMGTSIKKIKKSDTNLKKFNINNFIKELENNLDNFDNTNENINPVASNQDFNKIRESFTEKVVNFEDDKDTSKEELTENRNYQTWNNKVYTFLVNIKEPLIVVLLFILLNNKDLILLTYKISFINNTENQYPSLIIRGVILASIIYYLRNL